MCFAQPVKKGKFGNAVIDIDTTRLWRYDIRVVSGNSFNLIISVPMIHIVRILYGHGLNNILF
jgi:hypothetical protein